MSDAGPPDIPRPRALVVQAAQALTTRYAVFVLSFLGSIIIARALEASGRGAYAYVITIAAAVMSVGHLSVETALVTVWKEEADRSLYSSASLALAASAGVSLSLVSAFVLLYAIDIELPEGATRQMLVISLAVVPLWIASLYANAILANQGAIGVINRAALITASTQTGLLALLGVLERLDVRSVVLVWAGATALPLAFQLPGLVRNTELRMPNWRSVRRLVGIGIRYHPGSLALSLILRIDILIAGAIVSVRDVGIYSLAVTLTELALLAAAATSQVAMQVQVQGPLRATAEFTATVARGNALLAAVLVVVLVLTGPFAIEFVFGRSFAGTTPSVLALAPGIVALSWQRPLGVYVTRLGRPFKLSLAMIATLAANVAMNLLLIPAWGVVGAGVASSVVYVALAVWTARWFLSDSRLELQLLIPSSRDVRVLVSYLQRSEARS